VLYRIGLETHKTDIGQMAEDQFDQAVKTNPDDPEAYLMRGVCLVELNKVTDGQADIQRARSMMSDAQAYRAEFRSVLGVLGIKVRPHTRG